MRRIERGRDLAESMVAWRRIIMDSPRLRTYMHNMKWRYSETVDDDAPTLKARIRQARWIAICECGGAERVDPDEPTFYCFSCGNTRSDGNLRTVEFPRQVRAIENILSKRPVPVNRNWEPHETVDDLVRENEEHGVD